MIISIITPTYNNSEGVIELFNGLQKQTAFNFEWIIIDDGSNPQQQNKLKKIVNKKVPFVVKLFRQENQGKHIALNLAFSKVKGEVTIIIDSDDNPLPEMIEIINKYWTTKRLADPKLGIITFERGIDSNHPLRALPQNLWRDNYINYRYKNSLYGDYAETFDSSVLKNYRFPKFNNEKFLNEGYVLNKLGADVDSLFVDRILYTSKYRSEGLTRNIRKIEWNNPLGTYEVCKMALNNPYLSRKSLFKNIVKYCLFGLKNNISVKKLKNSVSEKYMFFICLPVSFALYIVFSLKYNE